MRPAKTVNRRRAVKRTGEQLRHAHITAADIATINIAFGYRRGLSRRWPRKRRVAPDASKC